MNLLLDTNLVIDYVGKREPFYSSAEKLVVAGFFKDVKLWVSAQSIKDAYYVLSNKTDQLHVQRVLRRFLDVVTVVSLSADDALRGLYLEWEDYEDCVISLCAMRAKADFIITRDEKGFMRSSVPIMSPDAWAKYMRAELHLEYDALD